MAVNETRTKTLSTLSAILASFALVVGCATVKPQPAEPDPGAIAGVVIDASGRRLGNAYVLIVAGPMARAATMTDIDGSFSLPLRAGRYDLMVEKDGYEAASTTGLEVTAGTELMLNVKLHPGEMTNGKSLDLGTAVIPPIVVSGPHPEYTREAIAHGVQGTLILKCIITVDGFVRNCRVVQSLQYLQGNAIAAVQSRRYRPAMRNGKPVQVDYTIRVNYSLP
jgi:TonB family protein